MKELTAASAGKVPWIIQKPIAHRGLHDKSRGRPENSLAAFEAAISKGYAIECDLQLSADGEAMVFHDETLDRLTNETGPVRHRRAAELSEISYAEGAGTIASLPDMLDMVAGRTALVIEIKSLWNGDLTLVQRTLDCLRNYQGEAAVMSFDPAPIAWAAANEPGTARGIITDGALDPDYDALPVSARMSLRELRHLPDTQPNFLSVGKHWLQSPVIKRARQRGMPLICWTVRSVEEAAEALGWCDQITFEGYLPKPT